jgi:hypothetical protein
MNIKEKKRQISLISGKNVEEQKIISKDRISNENNAVPENENIAEEANKKIDQERSKHLH